MNKVFINAWQGPWGWRNAFYRWFDSLPDHPGIELVDDISEADVVFNADLSSWTDLEKCRKHARIVCNVLDFGEWHDGVWDYSVHEYVTTMKDRASNWTAISDKVIGQLDEHYGISADMFYYPSQIEAEFQKLTTPGAKKVFTTFARLGDPGKAVPEAIEAFHDSQLAQDGWKYRLIGPENPRVDHLPPGVVPMGYISDVASLIMIVSQSAYVLMPSRGEGLGLPIIEGALLTRPFIARNIDPPQQIFRKIWDPKTSFTDDSELSNTLISAANDFKSENYMHKASYGFGIAQPWLRDTAFKSLLEFLRRV